MTVKELINELKQYDRDLNVAIVTDWNCCDEWGNLPTQVSSGTSTQTYCDIQFGDNEETEVIITIE